MKIFTCVARYVLVLCLLLFLSLTSRAQRIYATSQDSGASGLLCINCTVSNGANAADGNVQTFSTINVTVGLAAKTYQELIFAGIPIAANTPVTVKLGTGNNLVSATALGGIVLQAYNGTTAVGQPVTASTLISALANNNQIEVSITPTAAYDRIRVTLNGGLLGALSSLFLYEGFYNGAAAGACNSPIDELHGISSGLLSLGLSVGGVVNPQNAYDGSLTTFSTLNAGVGLVGATAQQTIIYEAPSVVGDSIRLTLSVPQSLLAAGVLSNISVSTYNGTSGTAETYALNSSLLNVQLLTLIGGTQNLTVTYAPLNIFDRVQVTLGGGIANVLSTLNFYEAQKLIPRPVIKFNNVIASVAPICSGTSATLTAVAQPNTTFLWYTVATGGLPVFTGSSFATPVLTANATYYVAAMRTGCTDQSERTAITVNVNAVPGNVTVTNPAVTVCPGQPATFTAQAVAGVTVNWFTAASGGTAIATGNSFTTPALTITTNYYAEAQSGGTCVSPGRTLVTATVSALPAAPDITIPNVTICPNDVAVFSITTPAIGLTYIWYTTATGGTPLYTGTTFTTPALTATTSYYAEAVNLTGCPSATRIQATVTVSPAPADPILAANNQTISAGQTATINVTNAQTGITYNWYTTATASASVFTGATFTTPALFSNTTYYVAALNATGCQSADRTAITITVTVNTNTPCAFANNESSSINNICIGCSITNNVLATDADTTTASTISVLAGLLGGSASQQLIFQQPGFAGDTVKLELGSPANLLSAGVAANIQVALYNGTTLVATYPLSSNLLTVSLLSGGTRYAVFVPATGPYDRVQVTLSSGVAGLITSLNVYYAVQEYPKSIFNPASPEICMGSTAVINITSPTNGTFQFYTAPVGGTLAGTGTSFITPALNANTTYYIAYTRGTCTSPNRYPVQILVDSPPAAPVVNPTSASIFSGQTATFTATVPNNVTVNWYTTPTGGTSVFTGTTFTTPALTANTTYYAQSSAGSCVSTTRTPAIVTVQPVVVPDVTVTPPTQTINPGTTAILTASSTTPGTVFNWYTTPTGGTSIYTGATFTTPPVFANITYYAQATVTATGTVSATRAAGVVTVTSSTVNPTPCDAAIAETTDINGLICLGCAINNETASVDADRNTFSQLSVPVGLLNAYAQQTLRFANTGIAGDSVVVELGIPGNLASVGVLSGISLATYNGGTYNNDRFNINTALVSVTLLNGSTRFRYAFVATAPFDRIEIRLNSTASVLNSLNIYDAYEEVAAPVISTSTVTACQGTQSTLIATVPADATVRWYSTATGGTPLSTGTTFNTPALTATTTYYAEASRTADGCTQAVRTPATVNVVPLPVAPVVTAPTQTVCSGSAATFAAQAVTGVTYNWYSVTTGGTPVFTGNPFTTPALTAATSYYVEADNAGSCASSTRTMVTANVTTTPSVPIVTSPVQTCSGSTAVLTATSAQPGVTFNWYTAATGGTPIFTGAQYTTPALTANTTYYVEAANGTCVSATRAAANVIVNPPPANPVVITTPANGQITSGQTATLAATSATAGVTFNWYTTATGGTPIFTGATYVTPALFSTATYYAEATNTTTGCVSLLRTAVTITVNTIFNTTCDFASSQSNTTSGVLCVGCGVINPNNAVDADTTSFSQLNLTVALLNAYVAQTLTFSDPGLVGDTVAIRLRIPAALLSAAVLGNIQIQSFNGATANGDAVTLNSGLIKIQLLSGSQDVLVKFVPGAAYNAVQIRLVGNVLGALNTLDVFYATKQVEKPQLAASTVNICSGTTATFTVSNPRTGLTYTWFDIGGTVVHTGTSYTTGTLSVTTTYYVQSSRTATGCANPNKVAATVNVTPSPVPPVLAQNAVQICFGDNVTLSVTNGTGFTINWYDAATGGNLLFTGANYQVTPVTTTSYYVELTNGTCTSPSRTVATVTVNPRPLQPGVLSNNIIVCSGSPATITVTGPQAGVTYNYYAAATGGAILGSGSTFTTPNITVNTTYYIEAANTASGCINNNGRTVVNINVTSPIAAPALSATNTQVCSGGSISIDVTNPIAGLTYNWYYATTGGALIFTGTTFVANNVTANAKYYVEAANSLGCISATRTETDINVTPIPTSPTIQTAAGGNSVCSGSSATLMVVNPVVGDVYRWYNAATSGTLIYTGTEYITPALTIATIYYVEAANAGNCNSSTRTAVTITINALPTDPVLVNNVVSVCLGSPATFTITSPQAGVTYNWYDSPAATHLVSTGTTYTTGPITNTTDFYVSAVNVSGCTSTNLALAQATVTPAPAAPALTNGNTITTCNGTQVTLSIANPQTGFTYNYYAAATGGASLATGTSYTTPVLTTNTTYYVDATNVTGCTSATRTAVIINIATPPAAPTAGTTGTTICTGNATTITATSTDPTATITWFANAAGGTALGTGNSFITPVLTATTTYYAEAENAGGCPSATRTAVTVTVSPTPDAAIAGTGGTIICANNATTITATSTDATATITWFAAATGGTVLATGNSFATPVLITNTTYYAQVTNITGCISLIRTAVTIIVNPLPTDPTLASASVAVCSGSTATLSVSPPQAGVTYNWYNSAISTTVLFTGASYVTGPITAPTAYYVSGISASGCTSASRTQAQVTITPAPTAPALTNGLIVSTCTGTQVTLSIANPLAGYTYNWYTDATTGSSINTGTSFTTPVLTAATTYYVDATNSAGCISGSRTAVTINIATPPAAPTAGTASITICTGNATTITATSTDPTATITWFANAGGGTALGTGNSFITPVLTATTTYYVEAENSGGCPSATRTAVTVTVSPTPNAAIAGTGGTSICPNNATTITATSTDATATITWYGAATGGIVLATGNSYTTPVLVTITTYYAQVTNTTGCTAATRTLVTVTVNPLPADPTLASANVVVCSGNSATLIVSSPQAGITYNWYDSATSTTVMFTGATYVTGPITVPTTYFVSAVNASGCISIDRAQAQVTIQAPPTAPAVTTPGTVQTCAGTAVTISIANPQAGYTYNWYAGAAGGSSVFTGTDFTTPVLTSGTTYYVDATNSTGCTSATRTAVNISVTNAPGAPTVSNAGTSICPNNITTLTATTNDPGAVINWYSTVTVGTVSATGGSFTTPLLSTNTTYYVGATNTISGCTSTSRTPVTVTILQPLAAPVVAVSATTISTVTFGWSSVTGATGYQVSIDNGATFIDPGSGSLTYTVAGLNPGQAVTLIVRALGATGCELSANSDAATGTAQNPFADQIFVPNAFTPNGDGRNDIEYVYGTSISSLTFYVYNQWGEMIFKSDNKATGWDGTYKGTNQPVGVYVYYVQATMNDGNR
jgi:gliding motility-associated-like protein